MVAGDLARRRLAFLLRFFCLLLSNSAAETDKGPTVAPLTACSVLSTLYICHIRIDVGCRILLCATRCGFEDESLRTNDESGKWGDKLFPYLLVLTVFNLL